MASKSSGQRAAEVSIRPLTLEDVERFRAWGHHTDILFSGYDFPDLSSGRGGYRLQSLLWFYRRHVPLFRWLYAIEDASGSLVGYLKAVRKSLWRGSAEISIVLDPDRIGQGSGSQATELFIGVCFQDLKLRELWLRVLQLNERARRVYEKTGFEYFKSREEPYDDESHREELLRQYPQEFSVRAGKLMSHYHYMKLTRSMYRNRSGRGGETHDGG